MTDDRGNNPASWVASVRVSSPFLDDDNNPLPGNIDYDAGAATTTGSGGSTVASSSFALSSSNHAVQTATGWHFNNTATWNPTLTVHTSGAPAGSYEGTITHSVA